MAADRQVDRPDPPERVVAMHDDYWNGNRTLAEIGEAHGLGRERVRQLFLEHGLPMRQPQQIRRQRGVARREARQRDVRRLWDEGYRISAIADELGIHVSTAGEYAGQVTTEDERRNRMLRGDRGRPRYYTDEHIFEALRSAADKLGRTPGRMSYEQERARHRSWPSGALIHRRFGSWTTAVEAAGLEANARKRQVYSQRYGEDADLTAIVRIYREWNRWPSVRDYIELRREGEPSMATVRLRRGRWSDAVRLAEHHLADSAPNPQGVS